MSSGRDCNHLPLTLIADQFCLNSAGRLGILRRTPVGIITFPTGSPWLGGEDQAMIVITCPKCRAELEVSNQQGGKVIKCPECGASLKVPMPRKEAPSKETQIKTAPSKPMAAV